MTRWIAMMIAVLTIGSCSGFRLPDPLATSPGDWPTYGRTIGHETAVTETLQPPLAQRWEHDITGGIGSGSLIVVDSFLITGNLRGELYAINAISGKRIGWIDLGDAIEGTPVVSNNVAYVALANSQESLVAYDLVAGKKLWKKPYGDIEVSPLLLNQKLYFGTLDGRFFCVSAESGEELWHFDIPGNKRMKGIRSSAASDSVSILFGTDAGTVFSLNAVDGSVLWQVDLGGQVKASPVIHDDVLIVANTSGKLASINLADGTIRWIVSLASTVYAPASITGSSVIIGTAEGIVHAQHIDDGRPLWKANVGAPVNSSGVIAGGIMYVGTLGKTLVALDAGTGTILWNHGINGRIKTAPVVALQTLFVATDERYVMAFQPERK